MKTVFGYWAETRFSEALELEAVREDQIEPLGGVSPKRLLLLGRGLRLYLADSNVEGVPDLLKTSVGT